MSGTSSPSAGLLPGERVLHRIEWLTIGFGLSAAVVAVVLHRVDWAKGLVGGALLGWLNFRWLSRGIRGMMLATYSQAVPETGNSDETVTRGKSAGSSAAASLMMVFRYALVALGVYVIFSYLHVPLVSIGVGLCALVAAIMTASVWEVLKPEG